jgi:hypothetical protein
VSDTPAYAEKTAEPTAEVGLVPQPHGGAILKRGKRGNAGGHGRPRDEVRAKLAKLANGKGIGFLKKLMDGEVDVRFFGTCTKCSHRQELPEDDEAVDKIMDEIGDRVRASVDHRLKGNEQALRFGIGTKDEVDVKNHPEVQQFVARLAQVTRELFGDDGYQRLAERLAEIAA